MSADSSGHLDEEQPASEDDREVTPVGKASKDLLELSSSGDQNTRAYQAPRELLELARRQQARRAQAPSASAAPSRSVEEADAAPPRPIGESMPPRDRPTRRPGKQLDSSIRLDSGKQQDHDVESSAPSISVGEASSSLEGVDAFEAGLEAAGAVNDAAPSIARSRPSRSLSDEPGALPAAAGTSLSDLVREASDPNLPRSLAAPSVPVPAADSAVASSTRTTPRLPLSVLAVIIGICLAIGFILAKWRGLEALFPRH